MRRGPSPAAAAARAAVRTTATLRRPWWRAPSRRMWQSGLSPTEKWPVVRNYSGQLVITAAADPRKRLSPLGSANSEGRDDGVGRVAGPHVDRDLRRYGAALDQEADGGAVLPVDLDVGERRHTEQVEARRGHVPPSDGHGLDGLVERARAHDLHLDRSGLPNDSRKS